MQESKMSTRRNQNPDLCPFCGVQFTDKDSKKQHIAIHIQQNEAEKKVIEARKEENKVKNDVIEPIEIKMGWDGIESYTCVMCSKVFKDLGLHLCFSHGMLKCRTDRRCKMFFGSLEQRESHEMSSHLDSQYLFLTSCKQCKNLKFSNHYELVCHRYSEHKTFTCTLCGYITSGGKGFNKHLGSHHLDEAKLTETYDFLYFVSTPIATLSHDKMKLDCNLCVEKKVAISVEEDGEAFLQHFQEEHSICKTADNLLKLFNGHDFNSKNLEGKVLQGTKRSATDSLEIAEIKKIKLDQNVSPQGKVPSAPNAGKGRDILKEIVHSSLASAGSRRPSVLVPLNPLNLSEEMTIKAEPTGNLTWGTIIPLIGGSAIGCSKSAGNLPAFHLSYTPFANNEKHLDRYWPEVPKYHLDKEPNVAFQGVDYINSVCPCAGLSMLNTGRKEEGGVSRGSDNDSNKWMFDTSTYVLDKIKPKVLWGENAPGLFSAMGEGVVDGLIEIGQKFGYSFSIIKTNSELHGLPQKRIRTFYFFWNTPTVPMLTWKNRPAKSLLEFLKEIPKKATQQDIFMNYGKASERFRPYQFVLEREGLTHAQFYKKQKSGTISRYLEKNNLEQECIEWLQMKYPNETFAQNKSNGRTHEQYIEHCMNKKSMGKGYWDDSPRFYDKSMGALMSKSMFTAVHPVEDRYLNVREMMHVMGLPHDFEIDHVKNINHIAQNVPVNTAKDMADEVKLFCEGKLPLTEYSFLKQDNITRTIVLATELGETIKKKTKPVVVKKENAIGTKNPKLQEFNKNTNQVKREILQAPNQVKREILQAPIFQKIAPPQKVQITLNAPQMQQEDSAKRLTRAARHQDPTTYMGR